MAATGQVDLFTRRVRRQPPASSERKLQILIVGLLDRWRSPGWIFTHIPSGESRDHATDKRGNRYSPTGVLLQRMGVRKGWFDLLLLSPEGRPHFLELKVDRGRLTVEQREFLEWCTAHRVPAHVAYGFDDAVRCLRDWGALRATVSA